MGVPDQHVGDFFIDQQRQRCCGVRGSENEAGADTVRRVHPADDAGVVDDRDQVSDPAVFVPLQPTRIGAGVVPVLGVPARDDLGDTRGAAGQLEDGDLIGVDTGLQRRNVVGRGHWVGVGAEILDANHPRVRRAFADGQDAPHSRVLPGVFESEADQVEIGLSASTRWATAAVRALIWLISCSR